MCCILIVIESNNPRAHISTGVLLHMYELAHQCSRHFLVLSFSLVSHSQNVLSEWSPERRKIPDFIRT